MAEIRELTVYEVQGQRFDARADAEHYADLCMKVDTIMYPLAPTPKTREFLNGEGCVQQDPALVSAVKDSLAKLATEVLDLGLEKPYGLILRYVGDSKWAYMWDAFIRMECIDDSGHEWGQPYFARQDRKLPR